MRVKRTIIFTCKDETCGSFIVNHIQTQTGIKFTGQTENDDVEGHISIFHEQGLHQLWIFVYDIDGIHESEKAKDQSIRTVSNPRCKRPIPFPSIDDIMQAINSLPAVQP